MRISSQTEARQGLFAFAFAIPMTLALVASTVLATGFVL